VKFILYSLLALISLPALEPQTIAVAVESGYLQWSLAQAEAVGDSTYRSGKVGARFDSRALKTERAINYKLRATWFTPEVIRASARKIQITTRASDDETRKLVTSAEATGGTVIMVEIDPNEGSGVIPGDWEAFLQPQGSLSDSNSAVLGKSSSELREVRVLQGVRQRNYDYDRFWIVFPLTRSDSSQLFPNSANSAELIVRIHNKEGRITWTIPHSIRQLSNSVSHASQKK
jgi:hypothetical protein